MEALIGLVRKERAVADHQREQGAQEDRRNTDAETGFVHLRSRYYDPATALFLTVDPLSGCILEWDSQHGAVEKYSKNGRNHLGELDPDTGEQTKDGDPTRRVEKQMWAVTGYGRDESLVFEQDLAGLGEDELARLLGGDPGEYQGGDVAISAEGRELLADRHGIRFEPDVEYFLSYFRDYPGQVVRQAGDDGRQ